MEQIKLINSHSLLSLASINKQGVELFRVPGTQNEGMGNLKEQHRKGLMNLQT